MSIRSTRLVTGEFYHIYNRGNSKQIIFSDEQDHCYFINLLKIMNTEKRIMSSRAEGKRQPEGENIVSIGAYCLMPNHFHILLKQEKDSGVSIFMQKISTAYVMYYNKKYKRTGGMFEGKFKSKYAGEDVYLKYLYAYIHLNPLKIIDPDWIHRKLNSEKFIFFLRNYKYSSFLEYFDEGNEDNNRVINKDAFPNYFPTKNSFIREIFSWILLN